jgi:iron complex transport system substrate-binding protein
VSSKRQTRPRIVSLAPSVSAILVALGAQRDLVGVSKWCKDVAPVRALPEVGDCWRLDVNEVMRLKPTLAIGSVPFAQETVAKLLAQPVAFLALNPRSIADIEGDIRIIGNLIGRGRAAEKLIAGMRREFGKVARAARKCRANGIPGVYCEAWPNPRISSPPWVAELVALAGGKCVVPCGQRVEDEDVARANPDVIVLAWTASGDRASPTQTLRKPEWQRIRAVRNRRVMVIRDELLNTPGPPLLRGARELLRALHGDLSNACENPASRKQAAGNPVSGARPCG